MRSNTSGKKKMRSARSSKKKARKLKPGAASSTTKTRKKKQPDTAVARTRTLSPSHAALLARRRKAGHFAPVSAPSQQSPDHTTVAAEPIRQYLQQDKIDQARAEHLEKMNPALRAKMFRVLDEQEAKIKDFADKLPEKEKAAFRKYAEGFQVSRLMQRVKNRELDTGIEADQFNFARDIQEELGAEKTEKFRKILEDIEQSRETFREGLTDDDDAEAFDVYNSVQMAMLRRVLNPADTMSSAAEEPFNTGSHAKENTEEPLNQNP
jgi:hypothetical protein